jgi:hypothetical protein
MLKKLLVQALVYPVTYLEDIDVNNAEFQDVDYAAFHLISAINAHYL